LSQSSNFTPLFPTEISPSVPGLLPRQFGLHAHSCSGIRQPPPPFRCTRRVSTFSRMRHLRGSVLFVTSFFRLFQAASLHKPLALTFFVLPTLEPSPTGPPLSTFLSFDMVHNFSRSPSSPSPPKLSADLWFSFCQLITIPVHFCLPPVHRSHRSPREHTRIPQGILGALRRTLPSASCPPLPII